MDLELWHLILLPVMFAAGWFCRGLEKRQSDEGDKGVSDAYAGGVQFLLAGQKDKAVECFVEEARRDPERTDILFLLGRLFCERGEYHRAVRVHSAIVEREELPAEERVAALKALAGNYFLAGLYDRAEEHYKRLADVPSEHLDALRALLSIYIIEHEWPSAIDTARALESRADEDHANEIAHYFCEMADIALMKRDVDAAGEYVGEALSEQPNCARARIAEGLVAAAKGDFKAARAHWLALAADAPDYTPLVVGRIADAYKSEGLIEEAVDYLTTAGASAQAAGAVDEVLKRLVDLKGPAFALSFAEGVLRDHPTVSTYAAFIQLQRKCGDADDMKALTGDMLQRYGRRFSRHQCRKCGFLASGFAWGCLECGAWDSLSLNKVDDAF